MHDSLSADHVHVISVGAAFAMLAHSDAAHAIR